jgi:hypothetical protein
MFTAHHEGEMRIPIKRYNPIVSSANPQRPDLSPHHGISSIKSSEERNKIPQKSRRFVPTIDNKMQDILASSNSNAKHEPRPNPFNRERA